ncbi:MAG: tripartite tricarboxylate transporter substrate binding protein, partial [Enhydrobacter sp.]
MNRRQLLLTSAATFAIARTASAQTWPTRPLRLVVPFAAGGGSDFVGRLIGQKLTEQMGQTVVVD